MGEEAHTANVVEAETLVTYERRDSARLDEELFSALEAADLDLESKDPPLVEFIDMEALDQLNWENPSLVVRTAAWGHPVRITSDRITVHSTG